jgi:hypothetical protein
MFAPDQLGSDQIMVYRLNWVVNYCLLLRLRLYTGPFRRLAPLVATEPAEYMLELFLKPSDNKAETKNNLTK